MVGGFSTRLRISFLFILILTTQFSLAAGKRSGKDLFRLCTACHGEMGGGKQNLGAPSIAGLPEWYITKQLKSFQSGARGSHADDFYGLRMRPMAKTLRSDKEVAAVSKYVAQLKGKTPKITITGNMKKGEALYVTCLACHGPNGEGNKAMSAPPLVASGDWYLFRQLKNFKKKLRGADAVKDPTGAMMAPMAMLLADDQAIRDVLTFISSKKK